jgi:hypothetical protein
MINLSPLMASGEGEVVVRDEHWWTGRLTSVWVDDVIDLEDLVYLGDDPRKIIPAVARVLVLDIGQLGSLTPAEVTAEVAVGLFIISCELDGGITLERLPLANRLALIALAEAKAAPENLYYKKAADFFAKQPGGRQQELEYSAKAARYNEARDGDESDDGRDEDRLCYHFLLRLARGEEGTEADTAAARRLLSVDPPLATEADWADPDGDDGGEVALDGDGTG